MVSQYTRNLILENARKQAESEAIKVEEKKPVEEVKPVVKENPTTEKKTDAEKLKSKKKE